MIYEKITDIEKQIQNLDGETLGFRSLEGKISRHEKMSQIIRSSIANLATAAQMRIQAEFEGFGPLEILMKDESITEIIANSSSDIWFEKNGRLHRLDDRFGTALTYRNFLHRLMELSQTQMTSERPAAAGSFQQFRIQLMGADLTRHETALCLRRHPESPWTFEKLQTNGWKNLDLLKMWVEQKKNFLVVGSTGSGKTSLLNACLKSLEQNERAIVIEDSKELVVPNSASLRLLTRDDPQKILPTIDQGELIRSALRLRPDRLIIGEIRGPEAKDLLMGLSTGHSGSMSTLHASSAAQALLRLEMLIQLGAPQWSLVAIRRLIFMSLHGIAVVGRSPRSQDGARELLGIFALSSLEETGFLLERIC